MSPNRGARAARTLIATSARTAGTDPLIIIATVVSTVILGFSLWGRATVWQSLSVSVGGALLPLVGASFLVATWTVSREVRYGYEEQLDSLTHGRPVRNAEVLGAAIGPLAWGIILVIATGLVARLSKPAGTIVWAELVAALLAIPIAWSAGMLFRGRLRAAPTVALLAYATVQLLGSPDVAVGSPEGSVGTDLSRLLLWQPPSAFDSPFDALMRPSAPRVLFMLATLVLITVLLLVRNPLSIRLLAVGGTSIVVVLMAMQTIGFRPSQVWASTTEARPRVDWGVLDLDQVCFTTVRATHCTYPGFEAWVGEWDAAVADVQQVWPLPAPRVIQRPEILWGQPPEANSATTDFRWDGAIGGSGSSAFALAVRLGETAVGFPGTAPVSCDGRGQGRGVFPFWLAALSTSEGRRILTELQGLPLVTSLGDKSLGGAIVGSETIALALALTNAEKGEVKSVLNEHWEDLRSPETSISEVATWFGLHAPREVPDRESRLPVCR